jgi:hypothetical protein
VSLLRRPALLRQKLDRLPVRLALLDGRRLLTNPASSDFTQTIIRVRTDGKFPTSPLDGTAVTVEPNTPGSADTYTHTGLTSGATYSYSAFSVDSSGNVGPRATVQVVASDTSRPASVNNLRRADKH